MRPGTLRVAAAQLPACASDLDANVSCAEEAVHAASLAGAELLVLPELTTLPYFCAEAPAPYRSWAEPIDGPLVARFAALAGQLGMSIVLGLFELDPLTGARHNAAVVFASDGGIAPAVDRTGASRATDRKLHLPVGDEPSPGFDEPAHFEAGTGLGVHTLARVQLGCLICYDRRFPECWRELRALDAQVVAVPIAGSGGDSPDFFISELRTHARENGLVAIAASKIGAECVAGRATQNLGNSCIVDAAGDVLAHRPGGEGAGLLIADIDLTAIASTRARLRYFEHRRVDLFGGPLHVPRIELPAQAVIA
ncbi:MAG: carbon-nitrogen hydrolase family protein [Solirubrobacteraceae bacterium]